MNLKGHPKVLVSPLNWGLGHATRCVPMVRELIKLNAEVVIGADGNAASFLKKEFPEIEHICLPDINMRYYNKCSASTSIILQTPKIILQIAKEQKLVRKLVKETNFDMIISDNRYGVRSKKVKSIIITHQLQIKGSFFQFLPNFFIRKQLHKFNQCLIPDFKAIEHSLAGELSHPKQKHEAISYIGPLSRFEFRKTPTKSNQIPVVISGPEPLKTKIINRLIEILQNTEWSFIFILGDATSNKTTNQKNLQIVSHLETKELEALILESPIIISTGGYSSIMDYSILKKKTIFIPFPGQTEQEYLAKFHKNTELFTFLNFNNCSELADLIPKKLNEKNSLAECIQNFESTSRVSKCISSILKLK